MKQETLEEFIKRQLTLGKYQNQESAIKYSIELGAKWQAERMGLMEIELRHTKTLLASCEKALEDRDKQAERMYSEEEVYNLLCSMPNFFNMTIPQQIKARDKWFEQFKKK